MKRTQQQDATEPPDAAAGVCLLEATGQLLFCDPSAAALLGPSAAVGVALTELLPGLTMDLDPAREGAFSGTTPLGRRVHLAWTATSVPGAPISVLIRERRPDVQEQLRLAEQTLRSLVEASPVCILTLDLEMNVTMWNPAAEATFGWSAAEVLGRPYPLVPPGERESFKALFDRVVGGEGFTGVEGMRARKDGTMVQLRIHTAPMRAASGEVVGALALLEDLSDQRRLEQRVLQAQKMEAVGRLAGGVAHDFNNLLTVILGMSDLLLTRVKGEDYVTRGLRDIHECAERARKLTAQLLAFSRQQVLKPQVSDLNALVLQSSRLLRRVVGEEVRLLLDLCDRHVFVCVDGNQFDQMLINLAANARDAMPGGGSLTLRSSVVEAAPDAPAEDDQRYAALDVSDTGEGIPSDLLEHIFDPFFTTKAAGRGTGLGLSTVYGIAEQSGGSVQVCSEAGHGTVFRILLPLVDEPGGGGVEAGRDSRPPPRGTETLLVVEDDAHVRHVTVRTLNDLGYRTISASQGQEALQKLSQADDVALVLTDLSMPVMGGRALRDALLVSHPSLPVIFMSAHLDLPELRASVADGEAAFLQKPATRRQLAEHIRDALDRREVLP